MMMTLFDDDQIMKAYTKDTREEAAKETALEMLKEGVLPIEKIAKYVPALTMEELKKLKEQVVQMA